MAHAPANIDYSTIEGCFKHTETKAIFEYQTGAPNEWSAIRGATHTVYVKDGTRPAIVMKTRVKVMVDEDDNGPVWETWPIRFEWKR